MIHQTLHRAEVSPGVYVVAIATARRNRLGDYEIAKSYHFDRGNPEEEPLDPAGYPALAALDRALKRGEEPPEIRKALDAWAEELAEMAEAAE